MKSGGSHNSKKSFNILFLLERFTIDPYDNINDKRSDSNKYNNIKQSNVLIYYDTIGELPKPLDKVKPLCN